MVPSAEVAVVALQAELSIYQGKAKTIVVEFLDASGQPVSGFDARSNTYRAFVRKRSTDTAVLASFTCTALSATEVQLAMSAANAALLPIGAVVFDMEEMPPGGERSIILDGTIDVRVPVTR